MTEAEYNAAEGIRRSDLWRMNDSPEKFRYFLENPPEQTAAFAFGSACHKMILEPGDFGKEYAVAPVCDRRTKEGKLIWETFVAENAGKTLLNPADLETMSGMEAALERCGLAWDLLRGEGQSEVPIFWKDPETGEQCKAKMDRVITGEDGKYCIVDYKTTASAATDKFNRTLFNYGYAFQAAMYSEGLQIALGLEYRPDFLFVAQEKKAPYSVNVIQVSPEVMDYGDKQYHALLGRYHTCRTLDEWPGYLPVGGGKNWTDLPAWVEFEEEEE